MTVENYIEQLPEDRKAAMQELRKIFSENLPEGFQECMSYGMIGYVVPHSIYPAGYHCDVKLPLPFMNLASQKSHIAVYHMGIYADSELLSWFQEEYSKQVKGKLDMGKSCIRFKKPELIPYNLFAELARKMSVQDWISIYEKNYKKS
jgi:uncharacterized protein YdhG (YjbR/CyaY superfamily)